MKQIPLLTRKSVRGSIKVTQKGRIDMKKGVPLSLLLLALFCLTCVIIHAKTYSPKVAFFGDGITLGFDGAPSAGEGALVERPYPEITGEILRIKVKNFGVAGASWLSNSMSNAYDYISTTNIGQYNAIVIAFNSNASKKDIGSADSEDGTTVMGQFNKSIRYIKDNLPSAKIIVVAPWPNKKSDHKLLSTVMKESCENHEVFFISQEDSPFADTEIQQMLPDGVYPSQEGYEKIGSWLAEKLQPILGAKFR